MDLCVTLTYPNQTRVLVANEAAPTDAVRGDWRGGGWHGQVDLSTLCQRCLLGLESCEQIHGVRTERWNERWDIFVDWSIDTERWILKKGRILGISVLNKLTEQLIFNRTDSHFLAKWNWKFSSHLHTDLRGTCAYRCGCFENTSEKHLVFCDWRGRRSCIN